MSRLTTLIISTTMLNMAAFNAMAEMTAPPAPALPTTFAEPVTPPVAPIANTETPTAPPAAPISAYNQPAKTTEAAPAKTAADEELIYRASLGRADDIKLLIEKNANPNVIDKNGVPVLFLAVNRKDPEAMNVVTALLDSGAKINTKDSNGQTALYHAARNGNPEMVQYLLDRGVDYYSLDNFGDIARTLAFRAGHEKIVTLMDDFVKQQTAQTLNLNQSAQLMSEEQKKRMAEAEKKKLAEAETKATEEKRRQEERNKKIEEIRILLEKVHAEEEALRLKKYDENLTKMNEKVYTISYNACAFQYWTFCVEAKQTIEPTKEQIDSILARHKEAVETTSLDVMTMFETNQDYISKIIDPSKKSVFDELSTMPSRTYRKEDGVGTLKDVQKRCDKIASVWQIKKPEKLN